MSCTYCSYLGILVCSAIVPVLNPAVVHRHKVVATQLVAMVMGECSAVHLQSRENVYMYECS